MEQLESITFIIAVLTVIFVMIIYFLFKKRISYIVSGNIIMNYRKINSVTTVFNFFPALFASVYTVKFLSDNVKLVEKLFANMEYSYIFTVLLFIVIYFVLIGSIIEYYFYSTNEKFKAWKDENILKKVIK